MNEHIAPEHLLIGLSNDTLRTLALEAMKDAEDLDRRLDKAEARATKAEARAKILEEWVAMCRSGAIEHVCPEGRNVFSDECDHRNGCIKCHLDAFMAENKPEGGGE